MGTGMRRRTIILALCALAVLPAAIHAAAPPVSWAQPQIVTVVAHGLLAPDVASFRPDDPLTAQELDTLVGGLTGQPVLATTSTSPVTITTLDARLVRAAGLTAAASQFQVGARAAGLAPPSRLGTEAVARLLGPADEPPDRARLPRAAAEQPRVARRGRLLGRAHARLDRRAAGLRARHGRDLRPADPHR